ncbi:MAG: PepSY-associated TM helix domain-containing protein [Verrucomicrobiota bacterium]|nr:PepSY-associated TM helix domain-containing protein [Verrucomicrobiota bacterium]
MGNIRKVIFWLHLAAGVLAGTIVAVMSFTGVTLAFEKEIIAWFERDSKKINPTGQRLAVDALMEKFRQEKPTLKPGSITFFAEPDSAALISFSRTNVFYIDPYSGKIQEHGKEGVRPFMQLMIEWHRWLGQSGDQRPIGKAITGACNAAFLFLGISGLYLWWPRKWSRNALSAITHPSLELRGKARDWNWHNAIGFWSAPILIVVTATAMPISYQWAGNLIYKLTGTTPPPPANAPGKIEPKLSPFTGTLLSSDAILEIAKKHHPAWEQATIRFGKTNAPVVVSLKEKNGAPRFATTQLGIHPYTGEVVSRESYSDFNTGRKVRSWTRYLHTGEALGPIGQALAGLASLGSLFLVWTGFALTWRRFFMRSKAQPPI